MILFLSGCATVSPKVEALTRSVFKLEIYEGSVLKGNSTAFSVRIIGNTTLIITNKHSCFEDATYLLVDSISQKYLATFVYRDASIDLCLLKTDNKFDTLAISYNNAATGDKIFTIGAPLGFFPIYEFGTVLTPPIVIEYSEQGIPYKFLAQTVDIEADHGSSGSPALINGKVVGVIFATSNSKLSYMVAATELEKFMLNTLSEAP